MWAAAVLSAGKPTPDAVFDQLTRHRPTLFFGVPTAYAHLLASMEAKGVVDVGPLRACLSAGEALPASLFERWKEQTGLKIWDGLGSTEDCHIFLSSPPGACKPG